MVIRGIMPRGERRQRGIGLEHWNSALGAKQSVRKHEREIQLADALVTGDQPGVAKLATSARRFEPLERRRKPRAKAAR
jgi:hypothetical protein